MNRPPYRICPYCPVRLFLRLCCVRQGNHTRHTLLKENPYSGAGITTKNSESGLERRHDRAGQGCGRRFVFSYRASIPFCWLSLSIYVPISWTYICVPILVVFLLLIVAQLGLRIFVSQLYVKEGQAHHSQRRRYEQTNKRETQGNRDRQTRI